MPFLTLNTNRIPSGKNAYTFPSEFNNLVETYKANKSILSREVISYVNSLDGSTMQFTITIWRNESDRDNFRNESVVQSINPLRVAHNNSNNIIHNFVPIEGTISQMES